MRTRLGAVVLLVWWGTGCPPRATCTSAADCVADSACVDGACVRRCNSNADCAVNETCLEGVCRPGSRAGPDAGATSTSSPGGSSTGNSATRPEVASSSIAPASSLSVPPSSGASSPSWSAPTSGPADAGLTASSSSGPGSGLSGPGDAGVPDACTVVTAHRDEDGDRATVPVNLCISGGLPPPYLAAQVPAPGVAVPGMVRGNHGGGTRWNSDDKAARQDGVPAVCPSPATACRPLEAMFFSAVLPATEPLADLEARLRLRTRAALPVTLRLTVALGSAIQTHSARAAAATVGTEFGWHGVGGPGQWAWPDGGFIPLTVGTMELAFTLDGFPDGGAGDLEVDGVEARLFPVTGAPDCDDQDAARFYATELFADVDGDGYGKADAGSPACVGWPLPAATSIRGADCRDDVPTVHPAAAFQSAPLPDGGGWDYNCDTAVNVQPHTEDITCALDGSGACVSSASSVTPAQTACGQNVPAGACDVATCTLSSTSVLVRCR